MPAAVPAAELADLSLEQLANITIASVSKRQQRLAETPASIYVITNQDLRRAGVASLPEALRLAPNLQVARSGASQYAISSRGFNATTANKLLVLIDGRAVYTPLYAGVFWDAQDVVFEDIDRIEVISGTGSTLWGANAVNGVINVITRRTESTLGDFVQFAAGNTERRFSARHGAAFGQGGSYRLYAKRIDRDAGERADGSGQSDGWRRSQAGFRADWGTTRSGVTLQGDAYAGTLGQPQSDGLDIGGANLLARWRWAFDAGASLRLRAYLDHTSRDYSGNFSEKLDTADLDGQYNRPMWDGGMLTVGGGMRQARDRVEHGAAGAFLPERATLRSANLYLQGELPLDEAWRLTLGGKAEYNGYSGIDWLPSARLAWQPEEHLLLWGSLARAARAPSRIDRDFYVPAQPPYLLAGGPDFESEIANTLELGGRATFADDLSGSLTLFYSDYGKLRSAEQVAPGRYVFANRISGRSYGLEAWANYQLDADWRLALGLVTLHQRFRHDDGGSPLKQGNDPRLQWTARVSRNFDANTEFDLMLRRVGALPSPAVPAYTAVDLRLGWRPDPRWELSLTAQNLFDPGHPEFGTPASRGEIARSVTAGLAVRF
ncbi:TonB-dependent receptor plug domain-containing protein [Chitinimonas koreensis]|uniref:TonB-dependent receptor plug domain-containing protein n=1 Tax=Chitinimonas koreensis TaxID=356302 RepID=UPI0003FAE733|nr:TonB-dependent receptor [Chitinimonas koreensis]